MTQRLESVKRSQWRMKLQQAIAEKSDGYYPKAKGLAEKLARQDVKLAQIRSLENLAYSTEKVSDILDLVKTKIGRGKLPASLGEELLTGLDGLRVDARRLAQTVRPDDEDLPRQTHVRLCREFLKHLAAHFSYLKREDER